MGAALLACRLQIHGLETVLSRTRPPRSNLPLPIYARRADHSLVNSGGFCQKD